MMVSFQGELDLCALPRLWKEPNGERILQSGLEPLHMRVEPMTTPTSAQHSSKKPDAGPVMLVFFLPPVVSLYLLVGKEAMDQKKLYHVLLLPLFSLKKWGAKKCSHV